MFISGTFAFSVYIHIYERINHLIYKIKYQPHWRQRTLKGKFFFSKTSVRKNNLLLLFVHPQMTRCESWTKAVVRRRSSNKPKSFCATVAWSGSGQCLWRSSSYSGQLLRICSTVLKSVVQEHKSVSLLWICWTDSIVVYYDQFLIWKTITTSFHSEDKFIFFKEENPLFKTIVSLFLVTHL